MLNTINSNRTDLKSQMGFKALNSAQKKVFNQLEHYLGEKGINEADLSLKKLMDTLHATKENIDQKTVLVTYGGGKDSSYMTAFVRYIQLKLLKPIENNKTFNIRTITNRQSHMPDTVMNNVHNVFIKLGMYKDKFVELFVADDDQLTQLTKKLPIIKLPIPKNVIQRDRKDLLMAGNLTNGEGRRLYCDFCNGYMQKGEAHAITHGNGVDLIITGDSLKEIVHYKKWINNLVEFVTGKENTQRKKGFMDYMDDINTVSKKYNEEIHGENGLNRYEMPKLAKGQKIPILYTIYGDTKYDLNSHRKLLDEFLGFKFNSDDLSFSFTESDCSAPALMAVLRGIRVEKLHNRSYEEGVKEYIDQLALPVMKSKEFPQDLIKAQTELYNSPKKINNMKQKVLNFYKERLGVTEENLTCMIYSPFAEHAKNLNLYIQKEQPELIPYNERIKQILSDSKLELNDIDNSIIKTLEQNSGITLNDMRYLYQKSLFQNKTGDSLEAIKTNNPKITDLITKFNADDPHKRNIQLPDGSYEEISGR
ncbi:MAG: hypothetical protein WCK67_11615 [bacterium]